MTTYNNVQKTSLTVEEINAVIQDSQNRVFMNGDNKLYREQSDNSWSNTSQASSTWNTVVKST